MVECASIPAAPNHSRNHALEVLKADELADEPHWWHHNAANFFNLRIVQKTYAIQVSSNLSPEIYYTDEVLQNVLGQNIGVTSFLYQQPNIST